MRRLMLSLLLFFAAQASPQAAECQQGEAEISTTPIIEQTPRRLSKAKEFARLEGYADVLIIGDSIAEGWIKTQDADFGEMSVVNMGLSGEKTQELLGRLSLFPPQIKPGRIILIIGTNNLRERRYSPCEVSSGILAASAAVQTLWPEAQLSIMPLLPMGPDFAFRKADREVINDRVAASVKGADFISVNESEMTCDLAATGCVNYRVDSIHPEKSGYSLLRRSLGW